MNRLSFDFPVLFAIFVMRFLRHGLSVRATTLMVHGGNLKVYLVETLRRSQSADWLVIADRRFGYICT